MMATAKQIAWRKKFAAMSRAGTLPKRRKNPARSKKQDLAIAMSEQRAGHPRKAKEFFERAARAKNPSRTPRTYPQDDFLEPAKNPSRRGHNAFDLAEKEYLERHAAHRKKNPRPKPFPLDEKAFDNANPNPSMRKRAATTKRNVASDVTAYRVCSAAGKTVAVSISKKYAVELAQTLADRDGKTFGVEKIKVSRETARQLVA